MDELDLQVFIEGAERGLARGLPDEPDLGPDPLGGRVDEQAPFDDVFPREEEADGDHQEGGRPDADQDPLEDGRAHQSIHRVSQPLTSSCHWIEFCGFSTQWFSSG